MWRIYSPKSNGVRVRTTIWHLYDSLFNAISRVPDFTCCVGKVLYLNKRKLKEHANNTFDDDGISVENLFKSLLVKRPAFRHEKEIRILYDEIDYGDYAKDLFQYSIDPHILISLDSHGNKFS